MSFRACAAAVLLLSGVAFFRAGLPGWYGYLLGAAGSTLNLWAWYVLIGFVGRLAAETESPKGGTLLVFLAFLMKLPVLVALYAFSRRIGAEASSCFLMGLVLVYFALAGWSLGKSQEPPRDSNGRSL